MGQQFAFSINQEGKALGDGTNSGHFFGHRVQMHVGTHHSRGLTCGAYGFGKGDGELASARVHIGWRQHRRTGLRCLLVPRPGGAVVALGHGVVKDIALVGIHKIRVVERAGLFGGPQKWQRLCLAHRQFQGARDTLLLTHPFRQLVGVGSRHLPHPVIQLRQRVLAHHEKGGQGQRQKRENGDRYANGDQSGAQGLKHINN